MSIFRKRKSDDAINNMSDREILEFLYREVIELKERFDDFEESSGGNETVELKKEIRANAQFMQQLVMESIGAVRDKSAKPTATELYMQQKKEREAKEAAEAQAAKEKAAERAAARKNGEGKIVV